MAALDTVLHSYATSYFLFILQLCMGAGSHCKPAGPLVGSSYALCGRKRII